MCVCLLLVRPNWLKKLFTDFITFTVKLVVKGQVRVKSFKFGSVFWLFIRLNQWHISSDMQICKEINKLADIMADFIQDTAGE